MTSGPTPGYRSQPNFGSKAVQFSLDDAQRISRAVVDSERSRRGRKPSVLPRAAGGGGGAADRAQFTGSWFKGQTKVVTILSSTTTAQCTNYIVDVLYSNATSNCFIVPDAAVEGQYTLLIPECIR
jgi:hypothetical protein